MEFCNTTKPASSMYLLRQNMKGYLLKGKIKQKHGPVIILVTADLQSSVVCVGKLQMLLDWVFGGFLSLSVQISMQFSLVISN